MLVSLKFHMQAVNGEYVRNEKYSLDSLEQMRIGKEAEKFKDCNVMI
jgi:hypothetical protein